MTDQDSSAAEMLTRLGRIAVDRERLDEERDELVRALMRTDAKREDIAEAAGVKVARLYQIRDGRR